MNPTSSAEIEQAATYIHQSMTRQIEGILVFTDAAALAADQVQDKRIEILEIGPEVTGLDIFLEFALTFLLESRLVAVLLRKVAHDLFLRRANLCLAAKQVALYKTVRKTPIQLTTAHLGISRLVSEVRTLEAYSRALYVVGSKADEVLPWGAAFFKSLRAASQKKEQDIRSNMEPSDTPGVAIQDLAQAYASTQRIAIQTEHSILELALRTGIVRPQDIYDSLQWNQLEVDGREISLAVAKDHAKRYFELLIWTLLLYERPLNGKSVTTPRQSFTLRDYVQPKLLHYWLKRFIDPETGKPFSETPALKREGKSDLDLAIPTLGNYMWKIAEKAVENKVALVSAGFLLPKDSLLK